MCNFWSNSNFVEDGYEVPVIVMADEATYDNKNLKKGRMVQTLFLYGISTLIEEIGEMISEETT